MCSLSLCGRSLCSQKTEDRINFSKWILSNSCVESFQTVNLVRVSQATKECVFCYHLNIILVYEMVTSIRCSQLSMMPEVT